MVTGRELTYAEKLAAAWAVTWRLLLADLVLLLLIALFAVAFGSLRSPIFGVVVLAAYLLAKWLVAWPFVIRRTLAPQFMLPLAGIASGFDPKRIPIRYSACVALGIVVDVVSFFPVLLVLLGLRHAGLLAVSALLAAVLFVAVRLTVVLPAIVSLLARRVAGTFATATGAVR